METRLHKRFLWYGCFHRQCITGESTSYNELTGGLNYQANANLVIRPEIRYDWSPTDFPGDYNRAIFGIDAVLTF